jgi:hypothetical protein
LDITGERLKEINVTKTSIVKEINKIYKYSSRFNSGSVAIKAARVHWKIEDLIEKIEESKHGSKKKNKKGD